MTTSHLVIGIFLYLMKVRMGKFVWIGGQSFILSFFLSFFLHTAQGNLWCYSCVSSQPGCEEYSVNWLIHHAITCPREDDKCVKIIERRGGECGALILQGDSPMWFKGEILLLPSVCSFGREGVHSQWVFSFLLPFRSILPLTFRSILPLTFPFFLLPRSRCSNYERLSLKSHRVP